MTFADLKYWVCSGFQAVFSDDLRSIWQNTIIMIMMIMMIMIIIMIIIFYNYWRQGRFQVVSGLKSNLLATRYST